MTIKSAGTYKDHLNHLTVQTSYSEGDYGSQFKNFKSVLSGEQQSGTLSFLLDFTTKTYPILGDNINQVMGHPHGAFLEGGLEFTLNQYKDFDILNQKIFPDEVKIISEMKDKDLSMLRFSKSYRFRSQDGTHKTVLQRNSMICAKDVSLPVAIFGFIWDITHYTESGKIIHLVERYNTASANWDNISFKAYYPDIEQNKLLSKREIEILKWSIEGLGSKQIADKLFISFNTVSTHRRNMLNKTNCKNSMELLKYAVENKLL